MMEKNCCSGFFTERLLVTEEKHTKLDLLSADPWGKHTRFKSPRMENASPW